MAISWSLISYNIFLVPFLYTQSGQWTRAERIPDTLLKTTPTVDVIVHQEVFLSRFDDFLDEKYNSLGFKYTTNPLKKLTTLFSGGVRVFSKWPILEEKSLIFSDSKGLQRNLAKGAVYAKIAKSAEDNSKHNLHLFALHLHAFDEQEDLEVRKLQLQELKEFYLNQKIPSDEPVIYIGDFNIDLADQSSSETKVLTEKLEVSIPTYQPKPDEPLSFDGSLNQLVGMDGSAEIDGCKTEYFIKKFCSCCRRRLFDFAAWANSHLQPKNHEFKVIPIKSHDKFEISVKSIPSFWEIPSHSFLSQESWEISDLSDHFPVYFNATF